MDDLSRQILESFMQRGGAEGTADANKRDANSTELVPLDHKGKARHHGGLSLVSIGRFFFPGGGLSLSLLSPQGILQKKRTLKKLTPFEKVGPIRRDIGILDKLYIIALGIERVEGKHPRSHLDRVLGKQFHSIFL
jgi:hypothetical protein